MYALYVVAGLVVLVGLGMWLATRPAAIQIVQRDLQLMRARYPDEYAEFLKGVDRRRYFVDSEVNFAKLGLDFHKFLVRHGEHNPVESARRGPWRMD